MKKNLFIAAFAALSLMACKTTKTPTAESSTPNSAHATSAKKGATVIFTIASKRVDCTGVAPMKCLLVKEGKANEWSFMYQGIEGFEYQEGFEYVIEVNRTKIANPPADHSSVHYTLIKVISKTPKD
ncbi:MAG: DUF4377 domain-containing protein [Flavobacteriaceae bacterium]|nr:DUF4377 domain-containing protein [Flavobacteriaceae bacterium]